MPRAAALNSIKLWLKTKTSECTQLLLANQPPLYMQGAKARNRTDRTTRSTSYALTHFAFLLPLLCGSASPIEHSSLVHPCFSVGHGDDRRGAAARPARRRRCRRRAAAAGAEAVVVGGQERGVRDGRPRRRRTGLEGAGGGVAAGEGVPEERVPRRGGGGGDVAGEGEGREAGGDEAGRRRRPVCEGEHGRGSLPPKGGPADVRRVQGATGRARRALRLLLLLLLGRRWRTVRRRVRGQGRRPHARRRRALGHVHQLLQEAEDHEGVRSKMTRERRVHM